MKNKATQRNHGKNRHHHDRDDIEDLYAGGKIHKLKDAPPYGRIRFGLEGMEAIKPETDKIRIMRYKRVNNNEDLQGWNPFTKYNEYEDINAEAEEFIEMEHHKFESLKRSPSFSFLSGCKN